jgi:hypothetical protein
MCVRKKSKENGRHHRETENTEKFVWVGIVCRQGEILNRLGLVRFYILRGPLSGDCSPRYRRDWPGDIWGTRLRVFRTNSGSIEPSNGHGETGALGGCG